MNFKEIAKSRLALRNAGAPTEHHWLRSTFIARLANDVEALKQQKETTRGDFRRRLERWKTEEVPENTPVCAIPSDVRESRVYRITGTIALVCEMGLAAWIFNRLGVAWWVGCLTAMGLTGTLHGAFLHLFDDPDHPRKTLHKIKCIASVPAIFGFLVALAVGMLARYVSGSLAVTLLPYFSLALWLGTLSLLILAASLLTIAHILRWSYCHEKEYRQFDTEEQASAAFLEELRWEAGKQHTPRSIQAPEAVPARSDGAFAEKRGVGFLAVLIASLWLTTGCATGITSADATPKQETAAPASTLHIYIDWSGSLARPALQEGWSAIHAQLSDIAQRHRVDRLTVWAFDDDGWSPRELLDLTIPTLYVPAPQTATTTELDSFSNIRDAIRDAEEQERTARQRQAEDAYHKTLQEALAPLESGKVLPNIGYQTKQSDIAGLLKRIAQTRATRPQYVIVVTDLADTRHKALPSISAPEGDVRVVVLHVPAQPKDALLALGKLLSAAEQYETRAAEFSESLPWATLAPYFEGNIAGRFDDAPRAGLSALR